MLWMMSLAYLGCALGFEGYITKNEQNFQSVTGLYRHKWILTQEAAQRLMKCMDKFMAAFCADEESPFTNRVNSLIRHIALEIAGRNKNLDDQRIRQAEKHISDSGKTLQRKQLVKNVAELIAKPFHFEVEYKKSEQLEGWCPSWMCELRIIL